jgi:hypothetical protein
MSEQEKSKYPSLRDVPSIDSLLRTTPLVNYAIWLGSED